MSDVVELISGPRMRGGAIEFEYHVYEAESILVARAALLEEAPETYDGVNRDPNPDIDPLGVDSWSAIVRYGSVGGGIHGPPTNTVRYNFQVGGGTARFKTSLVAPDSFGADAPDTGALLGVVPDGSGGWEAQGIDVNVPTSEFAIQAYLPSETVTTSYQLMLEQMAFTVNNGTFRGRAAGEVLFLGATGALRPLWDDYELVFRFARRRDRSNVVVPGVPSDITVTGTTGGWQYLEAIERNGKLLGVKRHTLYQTSNFSALGIPSS